MSGNEKPHLCPTCRHGLVREWLPESAGAPPSVCLLDGYFVGYGDVHAITRCTRYEADTRAQEQQQAAWLREEAQAVADLRVVEPPREIR